MRKNKEQQANYMMVSNVRKKIIVLTMTLLVLVPCAYSQFIQNHALGFMIGTSQYNGDANMTKAYYQPFPSAAILYKLRFNDHYVLRFSFTYAELQGRDTDFSIDYQQNRRYEFWHNNIFEAGALLEFNFLEFAYSENRYKAKREKFFSPYVVGGIALFYADQSNFNDIFAIPLGVGLKYRVSHRMELNVEWTWRKTFTDNLDLFGDDMPYYDLLKQPWFEKTKDWYSVVGISVLWAFRQKNNSCMIYEKKAYERIIKKERRRNK